MEIKSKIEKNIAMIFIGRLSKFTSPILGQFQKGKKKVLHHPVSSMHEKNLTNKRKVKQTKFFPFFYNA